MRIVAGSAKGVRLAPVPAGVRPISDRAREGLFSSLGPDLLEDANVLDLFAGTGAAGIEALSRGATSAVFVDLARAATSTIARNLSITKLADRAQVHTHDVARFLAGADRPGAPYDLVICDPPYELGSPDLDTVLAHLADGWVRDEASMIVLTRGHQSPTFVIPIHWSVARRLRYGDTLVIAFRPTSRPRSMEDPWV